MQVMGPDDGYICQFDKDVKTFWASRNSLELGATFKPAAGAAARIPQTILSEVSRASRACMQPCNPATYAHDLESKYGV